MTSKLIIPTNKNFGITMGLIFIAFSIYFYVNTIIKISVIFFILSIIFIFLAVFKSSYLKYINLGWMYFGFYIGKIISPFVLGFIFMIFFVPIGMIKKIFRNDELKINLKKQKTYWQDKSSVETNYNWFKNIF